MNAIIKGGKIFCLQNTTVMGRSVIDEQIIHYNHSIPNNLDEIALDVWSQYVVFESCGNSAILHGVSAPSEDEALQEIAELDDVEAEDLLAVEQLTFVY